MKFYGELLKENRKKLGLRQVDLAKGIISRNQLSNVENGNSKTSELILMKLYKRLCEYSLLNNKEINISFPMLKKSEDYINYNESCSKYYYYVRNEEEIDIEELNRLGLSQNQQLLSMYFVNLISDVMFKQNSIEKAMLYKRKALYFLISNSKYLNIQETTVTEFLLNLIEITLEHKDLFIA